MPRAKYQGGFKQARRMAFQRTIRRRAVARLYAAKETEHAIATKLGVSQKTVSRDVEIVTAELVQDSKDDIARIRNEQTRAYKAQIARLEALLPDLYAEWNRSKGNQKVTRQEMAIGGDGKPTTGSQRAIITTHERVGDSGIMANIRGIESEIRSIQAELSQLWGTYAPTKVAGTDSSGRDSPIQEGNILVINVGGGPGGIVRQRR